MKESKVSRPWMAILGVVLTGVLITGCGTMGTSSTTGAASYGDDVAVSTAADQALTQATGETLSVGDSVVVVYRDTPSQEPPFEGQIRPDGTITLLLNQTFQAAGKTPSQLEKDIRDRYVPAYFTYMTVTVKPVIESRIYYVGGQVRNPGQKAYYRRLSLVKAIQSAGDFTEFANKRAVQITRVGASKPIKVNVLKALKDTSKDVEVLPGDTIHVPRKLW